jgi:type VII secretion protein EccE
VAVGRSAQASSGSWSQATVRTAGARSGHRRDRGRSGQQSAGPAMRPRLTLVQAVLLEIAAAAVVCGLAAKRGWAVMGVAIAVLFVLLSLVPAQRRWLYQTLTSRLRRRGRKRRQRRFPGLASLAGRYQIVDVARSGGPPIAVIRAGTTWAIPLELRHDGVFNDDGGVPLDGLVPLLKIEDVPIASVRLLTVVSPAVVPASAPTGPGPRFALAACRYCILTLDTMLAAGALADRGGSDAAISQILRRCAMRAQEVLGTSQLRVHTLDEPAVRRVLDDCLGPAAPMPGPRGAATVESAMGIRVGGTYSTTLVVGGKADVALSTLAEVMPYLPGRIAAATLVLVAGRHPNGPHSTLLVRVSTPADKSPSALAKQLRNVLSQAELPVQRVYGEQSELLRASTLLGLSSGPA